MQPIPMILYIYIHLRTTHSTCFFWFLLLFLLLLLLLLLLLFHYYLPSWYPWYTIFSGDSRTKEAGAHLHPLRGHLSWPTGGAEGSVAGHLLCVPYGEPQLPQEPAQNMAIDGVSNWSLLRVTRRRLIKQSWKLNWRKKKHSFVLLQGYVTSNFMLVIKGWCSSPQGLGKPKSSWYYIVHFCEDFCLEWTFRNSMKGHEVLVLAPRCFVMHLAGPWKQGLPMLAPCAAHWRS